MKIQQQDLQSKINRNPVLNLVYKPHSFQKKIHQACSYASPYTYINICAGRRSGKSTAIQVEAILKCLITDKDKTGKPIGRRVWFVMPSDQQAQLAYSNICNYLQKSNTIKKRTSSKGSTKIEFKNGSELFFKSILSGRNLLGAGIDVLIMDEICDIPFDTVEQVLLPMLATTKFAKIIMSGTPRSKSHPWFKMYQEGRVKDNKQMITIHFDYTANPLVNLKYIEQQKERLPRKTFEQEYLAIWSDGSTIFDYLPCVNNSILQSEAQEGQKYFMGIDFSLGAEGKSDWTVITVLNNLGHLVFMDRFRKLRLPFAEKRIMAAIWKFKPKKIYLEKAGMNTMYQLMKDKYKLANLEEWLATNDSKDKAINNLQGAFENREITIPDNEILKNELDSYTVQITKSGKLKYFGFPNDDCVSSLYIAWQCFVKHRNRGRYLVA